MSLKKKLLVLILILAVFGLGVALLVWQRRATLYSTLYLSENQTLHSLGEGRLYQLPDPMLPEAMERLEEGFSHPNIRVRFKAAKFYIYLFKDYHNLGGYFSEKDELWKDPGFQRALKTKMDAHKAGLTTHTLSSKTYPIIPTIVLKR